MSQHPNHHVPDCWSNCARHRLLLANVTLGRRVLAVAKMLTLQELFKQVDYALKAHGIDFSKQPVYLECVDVDGYQDELDIEVDSSNMPESCEIRVL